MTSEDVSSSESATPAERPEPKEAAYLRANLTLKARRTPPTFLPFALLFISLLMAYAMVIDFQTKGVPSSTPSWVGWAMSLSLFYLTYFFFKGWISNTHTIQLHENAITAIALRGKKTVEFDSLVRCGLYKVSNTLWSLYFMTTDRIAYGGVLRANSAADRGAIVQLVNALHSRGVTLEAFPRLNCEFIIQYNTVVPEWQPPLRHALGEEKHRFKLFGRRPAKAASAQFVLGSNGIGLVSEKGVLEAYSLSEIASLSVEFSTQRNISVAKIYVVFLNQFVWKEEVEVADEVGKTLLLEASEAVKAMNTPEADSSQEDSPQKDNPKQDNPERDNPERDEPKSEAGATEGTGIQGDIK